MIMLFGVMPRAGTVHVGELLSLHPGICPHPNRLWEVPFLENTSHLEAFQEGFFHGYEQNTERMGSDDFLALFGAAFVAYLHSFAPPDERLLVKETSMTALAQFPVVFPAEQLLLLLRDGRDLVASSVRTWPDMRFDDLCRRWASGAETMLDFVDQYPRPDYWLVKFEDILDAPDAFIRDACRRFGLAVESYPFEAQKEAKVIGSSTMSAEGEVDWSQHLTAPEGFRPTGHWENWTAGQRRTFKRLAGPVLRRAGYAGDDAW